MSLTYRAFYKNCNLITIITKPVTLSARNQSVRVLSSGICYKNTFYLRPLDQYKILDSIRIRKYASTNGSPEKPGQGEVAKKGLVQRFKEMYRDYWYVLLPVHLCTSAVWFGSFYYAVSSGVDVIGILESYGFSETLLKPIKDSGAGYVALAFALYKLASPLRYAVTVGATTYAIKRLTVIGWIKPVPSRERIKEMLQDKRDQVQDKFTESKIYYQDQMKAKRTQVMDEMRRYKSEMRNVKNKVKKM